MGTGRCSYRVDGVVTTRVGVPGETSGEVEGVVKDPRPVVCGE